MVALKLFYGANIMRKMSSISIIGMCLLGVAFCGQEAVNLENHDLPAAISVIMESPVPLSTVEAKLKQSDPNQSLALLKGHVTGEKGKGMRAVLYINRVAQLHPQAEVRKQVADILVMHCSDQQVGRRCYEYLIKGYQAKDFSESSKDFIRQNLHKTTSSVYKYNRIIRLSGMANMQDQLPRLNEVIAKDTEHRESLKPFEIPWNFTKTWEARLAKARMGIKEDIDWCVSKIKEEIDNSPRYSVFLFDDLGYIRQPESVELLKEYFLSNRKLPQTEVEEPFASYLMPIMQQNLIDFPELRDIETLRYSTPEEINACKDWVRNQTTFDIRR
jgi:hypothetical protein